MGNFMKLVIEVVKENDDGSADAMVHFDKEALELLVEEGVISILRQYIEQKRKDQLQADLEAK